MTTTKAHKYSRVLSSTKKDIEVSEVRKKLKTFSAQETLDMYLGQDPRHQKRVPKRIIEIEDEHRSQAQRVITKFGGVASFLNALELIGKPRTRNSLYKWFWPETRGGTGGLIPTRAWPDVFVAARVVGVFLTPEDLDSREEFIRRYKLKATVVNGKIVPFISSQEIYALNEHEKLKEKRAQSRKRRTQKRREKLKDKKKGRNIG
jgi:hypothetical protein